MYNIDGIFYLVVLGSNLQIKIHQSESQIHMCILNVFPTEKYRTTNKK